MRHDTVVDRDGDWYQRRYTDEPAEPCAVCGTHGSSPGFRWLHRSGVVCCGACRFTVHALAATGRRAAPRPPQLREPMPEPVDPQLPL